MEQIAFCVQCGAINPLCDMLIVKDAKVITIVLDAVNNILQVRIIIMCFILFYMCGRHYLYSSCVVVCSLVSFPILSQKACAAEMLHCGK